MNRFRRLPLVRFLALVAGLAVVVAPLAAEAKCACDACACATAPESGATHACCCQVETPACCAGHSASATSCSFAAGVSRCCCEVGSPQQPAQSRNEQDGIRRDAPTPALAVELPFQSAYADDAAAFATIEGVLSPQPPARVLFCVWRN